jgi:hypothetical protein
MSNAGRLFHEHIERCPQCAANPFNLCDVGAILLHRAASELHPALPEGPDKDKYWQTMTKYALPIGESCLDLNLQRS